MRQSREKQGTPEQTAGFDQRLTRDNLVEPLQDRKRQAKKKANLRDATSARSAAPAPTIKTELMEVRAWPVFTAHHSRATGPLPSCGELIFRKGQPHVRV
jgi:hypothetical protein